jgi:hypothetical protein
MSYTVLWWKICRFQTFGLILKSLRICNLRTSTHKKFADLQNPWMSLSVYRFAICGLKKFACPPLTFFANCCAIFYILGLNATLEQFLTRYNKNNFLLEFGGRDIIGNFPFSSLISFISVLGRGIHCTLKYLRNIFPSNRIRPLKIKLITK